MIDLFTDTIEVEIIGKIPIYLALGIESVCALFLGGLIGFDRELKIKAAGLKTNIMICFGSMVFTSMSMMNLIGFEGPADPNRISAQIVSGIGFLGAGAIMQGRHKGSISGLTTAATIWVVAAIGYTIGIGRPVTAAFYTITVLVILNVIDPLTEKIINFKGYKFHLEVLTRGPAKALIEDILKTHKVKIHYSFEENYNEYPWKMFNAYVESSSKSLSIVQVEIQRLIKVKEVSYHQIEEFPEIPRAKHKKKTVA